MAIADGEELGFGFGAAHVVKEGAGRIHGLANEVEVFLHLVDVKALGNAGCLSFAVKVFDVAADIGERGGEDGRMGELLAALAEDPRIADRVAADHDAGGARLGEDRGSARSGEDVAVGEDGAADTFDGAGDEIVVDLAAIHFLHGAAVDAEEVDTVSVDEVEETLERRGIVETDTHLDGEKAGNGGAKRGEDLIDAVEIAEEPAADVFLVNLGRGTTEVEVDACDGMLKKFDGGAGKMVQVFTDELGEDRATGGVFVDRAEDVFLGARLSVDAKELGEEVIGCAVMCDHAHEGEVGDVLHRGERRERKPGLRRGGERARSGEQG